MEHLCGSDAFDSLQHVRNSQRIIENDAFERLYREVFSRKTESKLRGQPDYVLPVVFHVIHNGGNENIDDRTIEKGLEQLNEAFANMGAYYSEKGVNTNIQFCLAQRDEDGNIFNGIKRHQSIYTDMSIPGSYGYIMDNAIIDYKQYINIQIVKNACVGGNCNVAGFAGLHRIVVEADNFLSTTLMHEVGHFFGLNHTFSGGCKNDDCLRDGDRVCDTPPDQKTLEGCSNEYNSCTTDIDDHSPNNPFRPIHSGGLGDQPDDHNNYMDYNWSSCRVHFTRGQADRMRFFIEQLYASLVVSEACLPPCENPVTALFTMPDTVDAGTVPDIINHSVNTVDFQWYVDGVAAGNEKDLTYRFNKEGIFTVKLVALSGSDHCRSDSITKKLYVICPFEACFRYAIVNQYLVFESCSAVGNALNWEIRQDTKPVFSSVSPVDSFYIKSYPYVKLCLTVDNGICPKQHCENINTTGTSDEICDNGIDDDGDGLIDGFDPDCPCTGDAYYNHCKPLCEIIPDKFYEIKMKVKWQSQVLAKEFNLYSSYVVGRFTQNEHPEIITFLGSGDRNNVNNYLGVFNGQSGEILDSIMIFPEYKQWHLLLHPAVFSNKENSKKYIYTTSLGEIVCVDNEKNIVFRKYLPMGVQNDMIGIVDFNNDGIPELYNGASILNAMTGEVLFYDFSSISQNNYFQVISIASDVLGNDGIPELITGKYVFQVELNNLNGEVGNIIKTIHAPLSVENGKCAVADLDGDGQKEIIVLESNNVNDGFTGKLSIWNPATGNLLAQIQNPILPDNTFDGSIPFIGDVDGDCLPEIGVVYNQRLKMYKYSISGGLTELYSINTSDRSGTTGVTMFDFNQDGHQELVYRDENFLRIINGGTGQTIDSFELLSSTWNEYPVIVDIDNDGQAEILVSGSLTHKGEPQLFCFESASFPWAPARSVWNQYGYNPTFVNDDLTIPRHPQSTVIPLQHTDQCSRETCSTPYNNFMTQATYRTQEGCYVWPELSTDLSITASSRCLGDSTEICFYPVANQNGIISKGVMVLCYIHDFYGDEKLLLDTLTIYLDTVCVMMPTIAGLDSMLIVINDSGLSYPPLFRTPFITECDYSNNIYKLDMRSPDLGISVIDYACKGDSMDFTLVIENAGKEISDVCIGGGCYFTDPVHEEPLEITTWCLDLKTDTITHKSTDTIVITIPMPAGNNQMYWTINDAGYGPGVRSSDISGIYECNYKNNVSLVTFDLATRHLDIGADTVVCSGSVVTIDPGVWSSYTWSDLTTERINSLIYPGVYWLETTDDCHRTYTDTIVITVQTTDSLVLPRQEICRGDSLFYMDTWWKEESVITSSLINRYGCDSIVIFELFVSDTIRTEETREICQGDSIRIWDNWEKEAGVFTKKHQTLVGCDSIAQLQLTVHSTYLNSESNQICSGDSIFIFDAWRKEPGLYTQKYYTVSGCDSVVQVQLTVAPLRTLTESHYICKGDSISINGKYIKDTQTIQYTKTDENCKTEVTVHVILYDVPLTTDTYILCPEDSIIINNTVITESGELSYILQNKEGCDSLIHAKVTKLTWPSPPKITLDCEDNAYQAGMEADPDWTIVWSNGVTQNETILTSNGFVSLSYHGECEKTYIIDIDVLPDIKALPVFDTQRIKTGDSISVRVDLDKAEWKIRWFPASEVLCDTCFEATIIVDYNTTITLELTHSNGCVYYRNFDVIVEKENPKIYVPNIIQTQSKSGNHIWTINLPEGYKIEEAKLYDRWGNVIYRSEQNTISWDGMYNGSKVVQGVYVYYIRLQTPEGKTELLKGDLTVL